MLSLSFSLVPSAAPPNQAFTQSTVIFVGGDSNTFHSCPSYPHCKWPTYYLAVHPLIFHFPPDVQVNPPVNSFGWRLGRWTSLREFWTFSSRTHVRPRRSPRRLYLRWSPDPAASATCRAWAIVQWSPPSGYSRSMPPGLSVVSELSASPYRGVMLPFTPTISTHTGTHRRTS